MLFRLCDSFLVYLLHIAQAIAQEEKEPLRQEQGGKETVGGGVWTFVGLIGRCALDGCKIRVFEDGIFHLLIQGSQMQGQIGFLLFPKVGKEVIAVGAVESS